MRWLQRITPVVLLATAACSAASTQIVAPSPSSPASTPSAAASVRVEVPDELVGEWESQKGSDRVLLTLNKNGSYFARIIIPPHHGAFSVSADGTQLEFFGSYPCMDRGSYEWSIDGGKLTFTVVGEDECRGRQSILDPLTYTRRE
jgi:hypothetical protein